MGSLLRLFGYTPGISIFAVSFGIADREGLDSAFMDWCAGQLRGKEIISLIVSVLSSRQHRGVILHG